MSKSIYEEADLILNGRIADGEVKSFKVTGTTYCKITTALKQAQKQEKLLELYKRLNNLYEILYSMELSKLSLNSNYYEIEIIKVKQQIKELENE